MDLFKFFEDIKKTIELSKLDNFVNFSDISFFFSGKNHKKKIFLNNHL